MPNKQSRFWQELIRRNVIKVFLWYAGVAMVLIGLASDVAGPFNLPDGTLRLVIILIIIGFPLAMIFSWFYDVHPEGGLVKTKPVHSRIHDKSIAVLPFRNDSPDQERMYFINGTMEAILDNLCKIKELRVPGRTSVEQYRGNPKPIPVVAEEMNVSYLLEGSGHRDGNKVRLFVQLLEGRADRHIWSKSYDADIEEIFSMQSEIAQLVATEIEAVITPEEKKLIEKTPTTSLKANDLYQKGREELIKFHLDTRDRDALTKAQEFFLKALEYDPTYAKACAGVAMTFNFKLSVRGKFFGVYSEGSLEDNAFDSVLFWADKGLHIDKQLPEAYYIRGTYYWDIGQWEKAEQDYYKAIQLNPNYWEAYFGLGNLYSGSDYIKVLEYYQKAASLVRGPELSYILAQIIQTYALSGVLEQQESFVTDYLNLTQDPLFYCIANSWLNLVKNPEKQLYWAATAYDHEPSDPDVLSYLAESYINVGNFEEGLKYYKQSDDLNQKLGRISYNRLQRIGYAFTLAGHKKEADDYFDRAEEIFKSIIRLNRPYAQFGTTQYDLATLYACRGEKSKAMEILRDLHQRSSTPYVPAYLMQWDPMLDSLRDDPEFQQIANDFGVKFQAERKRVRQWLDENDML